MVIADGLEDTGRERAVELEGELLGIDVRQDVGEVARIEGDGRAVAFDRGLDLTDVVADLGVGADRDAGLGVATERFRGTGKLPSSRAVKAARIAATPDVKPR